ncbi:inositol monophosphatase 1 [Diaphorina citri]|uniref:Inositol-1-monophosphatase n=2 Tax=Diaphorina citri TaxID=121845 RepID=A0A1S3CZ97_DIACI|nr:inositol monophosphatase 1 [Diaphorina citri]
MLPTQEMEDFVVNLAKECGELVRERNKQKKKVEEKLNAVDLVTETDKEVEKRLIAGISEKYPDHKFIGEESTADGIKCELTSNPTWIIDPIDGTMNFVHGYPNFCISIGYVVDKVPQMGVIYCPIMDWLYTARKGCGAFHNGTRIHVSQTTDLTQALINLETSVRSSDPKKMQVFFENLNILVPVVHA